MVETVIAVLIVTFVFLTLFSLSHMLSGKILLEYASMRVARARAVGCNGFQCLKAARVSVIPVAGRRLWPDGDDERGKGADEVALARIYMITPDASYADGLLRYENWQRLEVVPGNGGASSVSMKTDWFKLRGEAVVDDFPVYMNNQGL